MNKTSQSTQLHITPRTSLTWEDPRTRGQIYLSPCADVGGAVAGAH